MLLSALPLLWRVYRPRMQLVQIRLSFEHNTTRSVRELLRF
jgi:hypothetical protein